MAQKVETLTAAIRNKLIAGVENVEKSRAALVAAIKAAGVDHPDTKATVMATRMAMHPDCFPGSNLPLKDRIKDARRVLAAGNSKSTKADRRTPGQDRAYGAARQWYSVLLAEAGVETSEARGGANNPAGGAAGEVVDPAPAPKGNGKTHAGQGKAPADPAPAKAEKAVPTITNAHELHDYFGQMVALMQQALAKCPKSSILQRDFVTRVAKGLAKIDPAKQEATPVKRKPRAGAVVDAAGEIAH